MIKEYKNCVKSQIRKVFSVEQVKSSTAKAAKDCKDILEAAT